MRHSVACHHSSQSSKADYVSWFMATRPSFDLSATWESWLEGFQLVAGFKRTIQTSPGGIWCDLLFRLTLPLDAWTLCEGSCPHSAQMEVLEWIWAAVPLTVMMVAYGSQSGDMLTENPFCLGAAPKNPKTVQIQNLGTTQMQCPGASRTSTRGLCIAVSPLSICDMSASPWKKTAAVRPAWS